MVYDKGSIGNRLRSGIADRGMTIGQFAELIGVSSYSVNEWCLGRVGMTLENACKICDALDWPLDRLVRREEWGKTDAAVPTS